MEIEKGIPIPPKGVGSGRPPKYPFTDMAPGDSAFFPEAKTGGREYLAAMAMGRVKSWKFSGRAENGGLRIWRTE